MKSLFKKSLLILLALTAVACFDKSSPNYQYMPNMYEPVSYEAYGEYDVFVDGQEAKLPAEGSIPRGWSPYLYEDSQEGYQKAKAELKNPLPYTEKVLAVGGTLYTIYCAVCHGDQGNGQGILVQREKILGIPSYDDAGRDITEGSVYHVMYYGLNAMGSYASQTSIEDRWAIDHYVMKLKRDLLSSPERAFEPEANNGIENITPPVNAEGEQVPNDDESDVNIQGNGNNQQQNGGNQQQNKGDQQENQTKNNSI